MKINKQLIQLLLILSITSTLFWQSIGAVSADELIHADNQLSIKIIESNRNYLEIELFAPSYQIEEVFIQDQTFNQILIPGAYQTSNPGQVQLPFASKLIAVPPEAEIRLEILETAMRQIPESLKLITAPTPARLDESNPTLRWKYQIDSSRPEESSLFTSPVHLSEEAWIRNQRVVRLEYYPIIINRNTGNLNWYPKTKIRIHFDFPQGKNDSDPLIHDNKKNNSKLDVIHKNYLLNNDQASSFESVDLPVDVLVTPPEVGARYRIEINENGIYKLTYEDLYLANPAIKDLDPNKLAMINQGQAVSIHVVDGSDGSFNPGDYVLFYGEKFDGQRLANLYQNENINWYTYSRQDTNGNYFSWKPEFNKIMLEKYTDQNVYWLYESALNGPRMDAVSVDPAGNNNDPVPHYRATSRIKESNLWKTTLFAGEETWFWEIITKGSIHNHDINLTSPVNVGPEAVLRAEFVSTQANSLPGYDHRTKIFFNSKKIDEFTWSGKSRFSFSDVITTTISDGNNSFGIEAIETDQILNPTYYFDWFEVEYNRQFMAEGNAIIFTSPLTGTQKYRISGFSDTSQMWILDITDPLAPVFLTDAIIESNQVTFALDHEDLIIAMDAGGKSIPADQVSYYRPPDWQAMNAGADYIFITHAALTETTQLLADYRSSQGLETVVIDINDLYNEFNFGVFHPIAIKNFLSYTFETWQITPSYALLVGDGHWNFFDFNLTTYGSGNQLMPPNLAWVDPWQGEVDSANLLATIVGDDPFPDLMIARLPVNDNDELNAYILKMIDYEKFPTTQSGQTHMFIAEDPDAAGDFTSFAQEIVENYITPFEYANALEIYEEYYGCVNSTSVECENVRTAIVNGINNGALFLNFIGHGSVNWWSHQHVFTPIQFPDLNNTGKLPVILSMTCLDGYWSGPTISPGPSMIEQLVRMDSVGAVGAFSPTGLGVSTGHDILQKGFYDAMMNSGLWELGPAAQTSKLWLFETGSNFDLLHTFTVFGDPALQISKPYNSYLPLVKR